ncbi:response regulator transcription factor [Chitinophagaceae bacterium LB-8]|jgi:DNA-binding NarL/FixJ family response regulator|uniref:Response regulator transcription factor n=1 Tax=Paraflavisolibacter caeni TaxID=2982496 RepID=A0A9X3BH29_9BACT|nr:response regulator transcription factor [Paraflavisolibacter caeni]MCU7548393.1 response regulator transcription factor [Paraflavisolibacter caeni]
MKNLDTPIKVIITDDHALFRTGVKTSLFGRKDIQMIGEAENGMQLLNLLKHMKPDVILLDISMPIMDGITTLPEIKKIDPEIKVIMLTMHNDHSMITKMMEIGANSYLTKDSDSETIYQAIRTCFDDEFYFNDLTNKALLKDLRSKREPEPQVTSSEIHLNEKETSILKLMCEEKSTKEIAEAVELSPRTVEAIRDKLKTKTGAKSLAGLIMYAVKAGIVEQK